ncbi:MAG: virginiamycin lyase, partial [Thermoleophilaceae bacterium]|nr:virginiamycin lyase [Thermoleophilaceae bacterium]
MSSLGGAAPKVSRFQRGLSGFPMSITAGPRRALWFTEGVGPNLQATVGRITTGGKITEFHRGISGHMYAGSAPIAMGSDKNLWFADTSNRGGAAAPSAIGRITPLGRVKLFRKGITGTINDLTPGPDGNIWFTQSLCTNGCRGVRPSVGRITPSGAVRVFTKGLHR